MSVPVQGSILLVEKMLESIDHRKSLINVHAQKQVAALPATVGLTAGGAAWGGEPGVWRLGFQVMSSAGNLLCDIGADAQVPGADDTVPMLQVAADDIPVTLTEPGLHYLRLLVNGDVVAEFPFVVRVADKPS